MDVTTKSRDVNPTKAAILLNNIVKVEESP